MVYHLGSLFAGNVPLACTCRNSGTGTPPDSPATWWCWQDKTAWPSSPSDFLSSSPPAEFGFVPCFRLSPSSTPYLSLFIWKLSFLWVKYSHNSPTTGLHMCPDPLLFLPEPSNHQFVWNPSLLKHASLSKGSCYLWYVALNSKAYLLSSAISYPPTFLLSIVCVCVCVAPSFIQKDFVSKDYIFHVCF